MAGWDYWPPCWDYWLTGTNGWLAEPRRAKPAQAKPSRPFDQTQSIRPEGFIHPNTRSPAHWRPVTGNLSNGNLIFLMLGEPEGDVGGNWEAQSEQPTAHLERTPKA